MTNDLKIVHDRRSNEQTEHVTNFV